MSENKQTAAIEPEIDFEAAFAEEEVKYSDYAIEDYLTFAVFWVLVAVVFIQFFTRYVVGNSTTWTEEIARYLLIVVGFLGSAMQCGAVRILWWNFSILICRKKLLLHCDG